MINRILPEQGAVLAGYAELINRYKLNVILPARFAAISTKHTKYSTDEWQVFTPRHAPDDTLYGHLVFAIRYEGIELAVLKSLFDCISVPNLEEAVLSEPNGIYARRIWFLYEYLQSIQLNIPDIKPRKYVGLIDGKLQYPGPSRPSKRHGINNNLPGVKGFCPLIYRTEKLDKFIEMDLSKKASENMGTVHPDVLMRAASFLLLKDSKASYAIEGETPPHNRAERWGSIIGKAGQSPLSKFGLEGLQKEVITDTRFVHMSYRTEGGFIGTHDRSTNLPIPDHISAKAEDLDILIDGLIDTTALLKDGDYPPVLAATLIAFGFVFIHPFEDGNGRLHRYLLHHTLMETGFTPKEMVFPVSAMILERISEYGQALEAYSKPRLSHIVWRPNDKGNVEVLNETLDLYRFFDATKQAEFLYECVYETVTKVLPQEVDYLQKYDQLKSFINSYIDMPDHMADLLIRFLQQNEGTLSKRAKNKEFFELTEEEVSALENKFNEFFGT